MLRSGDHLAPLPTKLTAPPQQRGAGGTAGNPPHKNRVVAMLQQCSIALPQWSIAAMPLRIAAMHVLLQCLSALPQYPFQCSYCRNADAACNALQHCRNTYCRNIEAHCRNAPFVASLRQCCYCKGHCGNALWHCCNTPIFSRCEMFMYPAGLPC